MQTEGTASFAAGLDEEGLAFFSEVSRKPFSQQAVMFLNAYWAEVGSQAEFIFSVTWEMIKYADMHAKGVSLIHKYEEGCDLDFNIGLYFYEKLCKHLSEGEPGNEWAVNPDYEMSQPTMMTAIKRKKALRDEVDADHDGRVSLLEVLLYQYKEYCNPAEFVTRTMVARNRYAPVDQAGPDEPPEVKKAREALEAVNLKIQAYENEKARLEALAEKPGVKGLAAKNQLAQMESGPLMEELRAALITAEAALRKAARMFSGAASADGAAAAGPTEGAMFWMNRDLEEKKKRYGK